MRNALHRRRNAARGTRNAESEPDRGGPAEDVNFRLIGAGLLAGVVAGLIAGGVGSRLAMRIVAVAAGRAHAGEITEAQALVGRITVGGTVFLLIAGAFGGLIGGVIYLLARRWMPGNGAARGLAFGFFLLAAAGHPVIGGDNVDFTKFVSPYLAVALFAALFPLYGLIVSPPHGTHRRPRGHAEASIGFRLRRARSRGDLRAGPIGQCAVSDLRTVENGPPGRAVSGEQRSNALGDEDAPSR